MRALYAIFLLLLANISFAQKTWNGDISINWSNPSNWTPNAIPLAGEKITFPDFAPNCFVDIVPPTIAGITITSGYTSNIDLNGNTLNIQTGSNNDFLGGTFSGTNGGAISITGENAATFNGTDFGSNVPVTVSLTNIVTSTNGVFTGGSATFFGGTVNVTAPSILLNGSTYNSTANFNKSGAQLVSSFGEGGNTFIGTTTIINSMNFFFRTANKAGTVDTFNGLLTLSLNGSDNFNTIQLAHAVGTQTNFNNHIRVRSNNFAGMSAGGINATISFGGAITGTGGTSTLASGFTLDEVNPLVAANNFQKGDLIIKNFTQLGSGSAQTLDIKNSFASPSASNLRVYIISSSFEGTVNYSFSNSFVSNSTFNNVTTFNKTTGGGGDDTFPPPAVQNSWDGGNTFKTTVNFNHFNTSTWVMGRLAGDVFQGDVNLYSDLANTPALASHFRLAEGAVSQFQKNINITSKVSLTNEVKVQFGRGGGTARFNGSTTQSINYSGTLSQLALKFGNLHMNNSSGLNLNFPATVVGNAQLQFGVIQMIQDVVNFPGYDTLTFESNVTATVSGANDLSYVDGRVVKRGSSAFLFPVGDAGAYHPIGITAPSSVTALFSAQYYFADHTLGSSKDAPLEKVSDCEYWNLLRLAGADNPTVTLYWNDASYCHTNYITDPSQLQAARWSGSIWNNLGASSYISVPSVDGTEGNLTAALALPNSASHILTLGSLSALNVLPIVITSFQVTQGKFGAEIVWQTATEINNEYFTVERLHGNDFVPLAKVTGAGTTNLPSHYNWTDTNPQHGLSYYRLKQTDFNGNESYSDVVAFQWKPDNAPYPNPVKTTLFLNALNFDEDSKLIVKDIAGRTVYLSEATPTIDFSNFVTGMYYLGVKNNGTIKWYSIRKE